ncbi:GNAT family N-acetyltransferase [Bhargavaea beijingensis]|uniref:GNAT family N-acetyltransferase n=1 Tax=Bhargavaea beijingensis TaxID=426756 RepID=UPI00222573A3|nr:GNAT family N-acetyltransferase [Bhargavaea beijingensis]MCW1927695.1 GNAT family N-acetyltransferase [Bhargavaea beijingensis]
MIRLMTRHDIETVRQIAAVSYDDTYEGLLPEDVQESFLARAYASPMMMKRLEKTTMLIAEHEGRPVGFANFTRVDEDGDAELTDMYLLPDYKGMGFGTALLEAGISTLEDGHQLFVYVDSRNEGARLFYEKQGFELLEEFDELFEGFPTTTVQYVYYLKAPALV